MQEGKIMGNEKKIDLNELENVSGGLIFNASNISGADPAKPWEVIDNKNGNVLARFASKNEAIANASQYGSNPYNAMEVDWDAVTRLRNNPIA